MAKRGLHMRTTKWNAKGRKRCQHVLTDIPFRKCPKRAKFGKFCRIHWREH